MRSEAWISAHEIGKNYGDTTALRACSLSIAPGEVIGMAGPNGAGKTTLARIIGGFLQPSAGTVTIEGLPPVEWRAAHGIGYLPEELPRPWPCTVSTLLGMNRSTRDTGEQRGRILRLLGIKEPDARDIRTLSKGQWRIVLTAFAMAACSRLIILDEPDSGLDPEALDRVSAVVRAAAEQGSSILILSHQLFEMEAVCDRVVFIADGELLAEETPDQFAPAGLRSRYRQIVTGRPAAGVL